jgi:ABC-type sulfate/molybdate transport systems ATPase subunit
MGTWRVPGSLAGMWSSGWRRLEQALAGFPGALLLVTHDGVLGRSLTDRVWAVERGRIRRISAAAGTPASPGSGG